MTALTYRRFEAGVLLPPTVNGPREAAGLEASGYIVVDHRPTDTRHGWYAITVQADDVSLEAFVDELEGTAHPSAYIGATLAD